MPPPLCFHKIRLIRERLSIVFRRVSIESEGKKWDDMDTTKTHGVLGKIFFEMDFDARRRR